jgi:hypothetical protein
MFCTPQRENRTFSEQFDWRMLQTQVGTQGYAPMKKSQVLNLV